MPERGLFLRRPKVRTLAAAFVLLLLALIIALGSLRYVRLYHDLSDGKDLLVTAAETMEERGLRIEGKELNEVEASLQGARDRFAGAADTIDSDPLLSLANHLPWLGTQTKATRELAHIGADGSAIGLEAVQALRSYQDVRDNQGGALSERVTLVLEATGPQIEAIEERLTEIEARRLSMPEDGLLSPLDSALGNLDYHIEELRSRVQDYQRGARLAPDLLGHEGPRTYLVLAHDNTEILGSGGFILVYGLLTFDQGKLVHIFFDDVHGMYFDWRERTGEYIEPPRPLKSYLLRDWSMGLGEASWWPDFPTVAEEAIELYRRESGSDQPIDGVIGINFFTLEKLLEITGPVTVEEYGVMVDSENVTAQTLIITHPDALRPWEADRYDFAAYLADDVIHRSLSIGPSQWAPMLDVLNALGEERNLLLYSRHPEVQKAIVEMDWDGQAEPTDDDYLMVVDSSLNSTKLNLVVQPNINLDIHLEGNGNARNTVTITYTNDYTTWAEDQHPHLARLVTGDGTLTVYGNYLRLLTPEGSIVEGVWEDGSSVGPEGVWQEHGKTVLGRYFALPLNSQKTLSFTYEVPAALGNSDNPFTYRLLIQKQPGTASIPLSVTVEPPPWAKSMALTLDGTALEDNARTVSTDLRVDRTLVAKIVPKRSER